MLAINVFPILGVVLGINFKDANLDGLEEENGDFVVVQILLFVVGISIIYFYDQGTDR